jgi:hypothetical protein
MTKVCRNKINDTSLRILNLIIHVFLAFIFLNLMFYFLIADAEEKALQSKLDYIAKSVVKQVEFEPELPSNLPPSNLPPSNLPPEFTEIGEIIKDVLGNNVDDLKVKYQRPDILKTKNNNWLYGMIVVATSLVFIIPFSIIVTMKTFCNLSNVRGSHILFHNLMIVLFVISFEVYFIIAIGLNYIPINVDTFITELNKSAKNDIVDVMEKQINN